MESTCLRHNELPHTSSLFSDFMYRFDRVRRFYAFDPNDPESFRRAAAAIDYPDERRARLVQALRQQNGDSPALDMLARPGVAAVVTGQQVGLLGGPIYTIYKALTAAKLAARLTEEGIPAVPVFWLATEDHDFAEVNHCWVFDHTHRPVRLEAKGNGGGRRPVGGIEVDRGAVEALRTALGDLPFAGDVADMAAEAYAPGASYGTGFAALMRRLLGAYGILYLDPMHPAVRDLAAPALRAWLERAPELSGAVLARNAELAEAGYHAQVHVEADTSFVFLLENGQRLALHRKDSEYLVNGRRYAASELIERAESLSPNALLRPVVQDYLLPTVAYVGGPAELAYLAQSRVIYEALLGRMPVPVHRHGATLLDSRAAKLMERYGLRLPDLFHGEAELVERMGRRLTPPEVSAAFEGVQSQAAGLLDELGQKLAGFDPTLAAALETSRRKILYQFAKLQRKVGREAARRDGRATADGAYLRALVYPEKHLQERLYSALPFLAKHGPDLIGRLYDSIAPDCPHHRILVL